MPQTPLHGPHPSGCGLHRYQKPPAPTAASAGNNVSTARILSSSRNGERRFVRDDGGFVDFSVWAGCLAAEDLGGIAVRTMATAGGGGAGWGRGVGRRRARAARKEGWRRVSRLPGRRLRTDCLDVLRMMSMRLTARRLMRRRRFFRRVYRRVSAQSRCSRRSRRCCCHPALRRSCACAERPLRCRAVRMERRWRMPARLSAAVAL